MDLEIAALLIRRQREAENTNVVLTSRRYRRQQREEQDPFKTLSDVDFVRSFRLTKSICRRFINDIKPYIRERQLSHGISAEVKIVCALRFFASGSYQFPVGQDMCINVSQPIVSRAVREVLEAIVNNLADRYICFPEKHQWADLKQKFFEKHGMPGVIGLVDGTHVSIRQPKKDVEQVYYAVRKSSHTKNVQVICDSDLRITAINARYGGSTHDSYVWNNSAINSILQKEHERGSRNSFLLGDSGYGQHLFCGHRTSQKNDTTSRINKLDMQSNAASVFLRAGFAAYVDSVY